MTIDTKIQTFFEGHGDHDSYHYVSKDGTRRCGKCGEPMGAFDKVRIRGGPADKCLQCKKPVTDLRAIETPSGLYCSADCVAEHARGEIKTAMTPAGERPAKRSLTSVDVEREQMRVQIAQQLMEKTRRAGIDPTSINLEDAVDEIEKRELDAMKKAIDDRKAYEFRLNMHGQLQQPDLKQQLQTFPDITRFSELEKLRIAEEKRAMDRKNMTQGAAVQGKSSTFESAAGVARDRMVAEIAKKMSALTPEQVSQARSRAVDALEIALFHTDSAVQAHLLCDPKFDDPKEAAAEMKRCWDRDTGGWRTDAAKRAVKMVEIMDARGKHSLR